MAEQLLKRPQVRTSREQMRREAVAQCVRRQRIGQAKALARSVYVYRLGSKWLVTSDSSEPPLDVAVWLVAANQNERNHET